MGNYISCKIPYPKRHKNLKFCTKVIFPTGEIRQIHHQPIKAAEIMMETPNLFMVNTKSLKIGRRFCSLDADDNLEKGNVYVMFPIHRKKSLVTATDMAALFITVNSISTFNGNNIKERVSSVPRLNLKDTEVVSTPQFRHRMSMSRSKKPLLETIEEEPTCSL